MIKPKDLNRIKGIYNEIPAIKCKGLCVEACGPIGMTKVEWDILVDKTGKRPAVDNHGNCIYLKDGKCSVYENRPLICRLFGTVEDMKCGFDCEVKFLTREKAHELLSKM